MNSKNQPIYYTSLTSGKISREVTLLSAKKIFKIVHQVHSYSLCGMNIVGSYRYLKSAL